MDSHDRPVKVLHIIDKLSMDGINPSSCTILFGEWIPRMDTNGFSSSVLTLRRPDPAGEYLEKRGIEVFYQGFGKVSYKNIGGIIEIMEKVDARIVHLHGYSAANFGRIASRKKKVSNIVHEHAVLKVQPHQYLADFLLRSKTDTAVAVSKGVKDFMITGRCVPEGKISVIPNGIKLERFEKSDPTMISQKREELGIEEDSLAVGTVTRLREEKGTEFFIKAVPHVLSNFPGTVFIIVGDGPERLYLEKMAMDLDVDEHIKFLGFRNDVPELLSILDVIVIPSLSEGFPLSMIEAMANGNAIVSSEVGGMKEVGIDRENVLFAPPGNSADIGQRVCELLGDQDLAEKLSFKARETSKEFSVEKNADLLGELYRNILSR